MRKYSIFLLVLFFAFTISIEARTTGNLSCPSEVAPSENLTCKLEVTTDEDLTKLTGDVIYLSSNFTLKNITGLNGFTSSSNTSLSLTNPSFKTGTFEIASLTFQVKSNPDFGKTNIEVQGSSLSEVASTNITILSNNNKLKSITIAGYSFSFDPDKTEYDLSIDEDLIYVNAQLQDQQNSTFLENYGPRYVNLKPGLNTVNLSIMAQNGDVRTYTLKITRNTQESNNNYLKELAVSAGTLSPNFKKDTLTYDVKVPLNVDKITISATLEDNNASFVENNGPRNEDLIIGDNTFFIQVKAQNGDVRTYTINVIRTSENANNYLSSLTVSNANINFSKEVTQYEFNVLYEVTELNIEAIAEDTEAKVEINNPSELKVGLNTIEIKVTAEDGSIRIYTLLVTRLEEGATLSSNNRLQSLNIEGYVIPFHPDTLTYYLKVKEDSLYITAIPEAANALVQIEGNENLRNGSVIKITVTSEDLSQRVYTINIEKESSLMLIIFIVLGSLLLVGVILLIIFRKKIFKKDKTSPNDDLVIIKDDKERVVISDDVDDVQVFEKAPPKEDETELLDIDDLEKTKSFEPISKPGSSFSFDDDDEKTLL